MAAFQAQNQRDFNARQDAGGATYGARVGTGEAGHGRAGLGERTPPPPPPKIRPGMKKGGAVKARKKSKPRGVGVATRGYGRALR